VARGLRVGDGKRAALGSDRDPRAVGAKMVITYWPRTPPYCAVRMISPVGGNGPGEQGAAGGAE
jgi:hypothetical protein